MNSERQKMEKRFDLYRHRIGQFVLQSKEEGLEGGESLHGS